MNSLIHTLRLDRLGAGLSFVCAIHCAVMPFVVAILPFVGYSVLADERLENLIVGFSIVLAGVSAWSGVRFHGEHRILTFFGAAFILMVAGRLFAKGPAQLACVVPGGLLFVWGHFLNHRLSHRFRGCAHGQSGTLDKSS